MKTESGPKAAHLDTTSSDILTLTEYIEQQAQGARVRPLAVDWDAEVRFWAEVYSSLAVHSRGTR